LPSFLGREHSDRRYAPSEHRLRERSPESMDLKPGDCGGKVALSKQGFIDWPTDASGMRRQLSSSGNSA
jgi:hypothetical protein